MTHWQNPSLLDRLDPLRATHPSPAGGRNRCLHLTPTGKVAMAGEQPHVTELADEDLAVGAILLGRVGEDHWWVLTDADRGVDPRHRDVAPELCQLLFAGLALVQWHEEHPSCPRCGQATVPERLGASRRCHFCGTQVFPRTDPAVIVAVTDEDDRLLLTHAPSWPEARVSVQAGFVEAGESAEQAVHRELLEETGLHVSAVTYVASQPWPFPRSLMLGFTAVADAHDLALDRRELDWGAFHTREEVRRALERGELSLPGPMSLAHQLIQGWLGSAG
ncbi:NAD(+) diphosphatase [Arachnia propionica]|uniref:NAD(+) diphosphatase n=1 Tax=Arachnia propionica TaxID=1750 RepID=A0A3P1X0H3_9ACTN|nr:NAD(+) diphosphatase [Arachnia propionica]RRD51190.1 NAD(+) diphosphatase [Arachnia propionica]